MDGKRMFSITWVIKAKPNYANKFMSAIKQLLCVFDAIFWVDKQSF